MIKLIHGECLEEMDILIEKGVVVDAIITDPPYGTTACKWDSVIDFDLMWEQLNKLIKPNGAIVLFGSEPFSSALRMSNIKNYKYDWVWEKNLPTNFLNARKQPLRKYETISIFCNKTNIYYPILEDKPKENIRGNSNIFKSKNNGAYGKIKDKYNRAKNRVIPHDKNYPCNIIKIDIEHRIKRIHPTQKPVALMEYLIKTYTNEHETVLDFTMGNGSTMVACKNTNRNGIGIEQDENYFKIATERINGTLF